MLKTPKQYIQEVRKEILDKSANITEQLNYKQFARDLRGNTAAILKLNKSVNAEAETIGHEEAQKGIPKLKMFDTADYIKGGLNLKKGDEVFLIFNLKNADDDIESELADNGEIFGFDKKHGYYKIESSYIEDVFHASSVKTILKGVKFEIK